MQSAYKVGHSAEIPLLRVQNDVLTAVDEVDGILGVCLDLYATFNTIDFKILLEFLKHTIGIKCKKLLHF